MENGQINIPYDFELFCKKMRENIHLFIYDVSRET